MRRTFSASDERMRRAPRHVVPPERPVAGGGEQLYTSGNPTYDAYFRDVHQQQVDAASWGNESGAHKALAASLELTPDAPDVTIVQATHESSSKGAKQPGLSPTLDVDGTTAHVSASGGAGDGGGALPGDRGQRAHQELERAKRLHGVEPRLDALAKQGTELASRVKTDFGKYGETKENEVANELTASVDVVAKLKSRAGGEARESEDFVADLERALETASEEKAAEAEATKRTKKRRAQAWCPRKRRPRRSPRR